MKLLSLSFLVLSHAAHVPQVHAKLDEKQDGFELSSYDEACNIGYCSIMGATIGGWGGNYTTASTLDELAGAVSSPGPGVVIIDGEILGQGRVGVGSSKTIVGAPGSSLTGVGLYLNESRNVILRNLKIADVSSAQGDAITIENSRSIWVDHCELSSTGDHGQNSSKGLLSIMRGSDFLTVTATLFQNHPQAVRVGVSDTNSDENKDKLRVTFARNSFSNVDSAISFRFGTGHIFNTYFKDVADGINTRMGAQLLIESSVFEGQGRAVFSEGSIETGYATVRDVVLDSSLSTAPSGNMTVDSLPYPYDWYIWETESVQESVTRQAGQTLEFTRTA